MRSHPGIRQDLFTRRTPSQVPLTDFFGGVAQAQVTEPEPEFAYILEDRNVSSSPHFDYSPVPRVARTQEQATTGTDDKLFVELSEPSGRTVSNLRAWTALTGLGLVAYVLTHSRGLSL